MSEQSYRHVEATEKQEIAYALFDRWMDHVSIYGKDGFAQNIESIIFNNGLEKYLPDKFEQNHVKHSQQAHNIAQENYELKAQSSFLRIVLIGSVLTNFCLGSYLIITKLLLN